MAGIVVGVPLVLCAIFWRERLGDRTADALALVGMAVLLLTLVRRELLRRRLKEARAVDGPLAPHWHSSRETARDAVRRANAWFDEVWWAIPASFAAGGCIGSLAGRAVTGRPVVPLDLFLAAACPALVGALVAYLRGRQRAPGP